MRHPLLSVLNGRGRSLLRRLQVKSGPVAKKTAANTTRLILAVQLLLLLGGKPYEIDIRFGADRRNPATRVKYAMALPDEDEYDAAASQDSPPSTASDGNLGTFVYPVADRVESDELNNLVECDTK